MVDLDQLPKMASTTLERFRLDKKLALVVGGSRGLGQAMALALSSAGANVCVVSRSAQDLQKTVDAISKMGRVGKYVAADVSLEEEVEKMVNQVMKLFSRIDILVNSRGTVHLQPSIDFDTAA